MYGFTIIPSVFAMPFILVAKAVTIYLLLADLIFKFFNVSTHPDNEDFIWTTKNFYYYSVRRWIVDGLLTFLHFFTQAIPFANWLLNLITIFSYWANLTLF